MKHKRMIIIALIGLSILPLLSLIHTGLPVTHDGPDHVARIANFYQSLSEGNIIPRWAGNLNWGYGHPILMFLYPLPSYVASLFHFLGLSFVDSTKAVFGFSFVASVLFMYLWAGRKWGTAVGFLTALLYGFAPYRFIDLNVRGAIGEHVAFIFPPLIFYCIDRLNESLSASGRKRNTISCNFTGLSLSIAGLILAHNAISLMVLPLIFLYILYVYFFEAENKPKFLTFGVLSVVMGFLLSVFYWIPALLEGKYTLRDIVTKGETVKRFVSFSTLLYSPWNYGGGDDFSKSVGFVDGGPSRGPHFP